MSDGTYQRTKRVNGAFVVRPIVNGTVGILPGPTMYELRGDGWRRITKGRDGELYPNVRNSPCPCGSGKRVKRCLHTPLHNARIHAQATNQAVAS